MKCERRDGEGNTIFIKIEIENKLDRYKTYITPNVYFNKRTERKINCELPT